MHPSSLALLAALAATTPAAFAVPTFVGQVPVTLEDFAHAVKPPHNQWPALVHDKRWHALVHGTPSFAELSVVAPPPVVVVAADTVQAPDQGLPLAIPEPQTWALTLAGLAALGFLARRRRR